MMERFGELSLLLPCYHRLFLAVRPGVGPEVPPDLIAVWSMG